MMNGTEEIEEFENIFELLAEKIRFGEGLLDSIENIDIDGITKLRRKINQEISFLLKVANNRTLKKEHFQCSNLTHFSALVNTLKTVSNCKFVNKVFSIDVRKVNIDIICDNGLTWMKVIARNPKALCQLYKGEGNFGDRSVIHQAIEYLDCAKLYPCLFQTPKVVFVFTRGIGNNLARKLERLGVVVQGVCLDTNDIESSSDSEDETNTPPQKISTKKITNIKKVNLDVSTLLAYCSSVTNGGAYLYDFDIPVLKQQAQWEREKPVKPILDEFFEGKSLYCCQTAKNSFDEIMNTVGGPTEQRRAVEFMKKVKVLPDDATYLDTSEDSDKNDEEQFSDCKNLMVKGKIRERSLTIFLFGDRIKAITVTSNDGFIRAAKQQNIHFVVFVHGSRALTEQKEMAKAKPLT